MTTASPVIAIDRAACMGTGLCMVYAPATFDHDDETKAVLLDGPGDTLDQIRNAVEACPTRALTLLTPDEETS